jgi:CDP-glucose 4,6-dehydratase
MLQFEDALRGRRIMVTGHTGFTGGWLCAWLGHIGAELYGYSLPPETTPNLWQQLDLDHMVSSTIADIMDYERLSAAMADARPSVVIHLAAQPLVRRSYREPLRTFAVNALGTANVIEAARHTPSVRGIVCITTDKVYENREWPYGYRESDPLGGKDPYSASKAAAEMIIKGYAHSFADKGAPRIAVARGGNIIGGGDWSEDRLIPDFVRAVADGTTLSLRFPDATRPWQHVLALVQGYGLLAAGLLSDEPDRYARAWNLGPEDARHYTVREVLEIIASQWQRPVLNYLDMPLPEAGHLALDSRLAINELGWTVPWSVREMVARTAQWYREYYGTVATQKADAGAMHAFTLSQIQEWRAAQMTPSAV